MIHSNHQHHPQDSSQDSSPPAKVRRISNGQAAAGARPRRAARACESCRSSKLRCQPPDPSSDEIRCINCAKTGRDCNYADIAPPVRLDDGETRLARLEGSVSKLLEVVQNLSHQQLPAEVLSNPPISTHNSLSALAHLAAFNVSPVTQDALPWLPGPAPSSNSSSDMFMSLPPLSQMIDTNSVESASHIPPVYSTTRPDTTARVAFDVDVQSISPAARSGRSDPAAYDDAEHDRYPSTQARPLPKVPTTSRMAAFTDPLAHEAPFRPLTYNPDTYKNTEFSRQGSEEAHDQGTGLGDADGRKTPKRGRGDPIDRNVLTEVDARALFDFFKREVVLFLPILQEPISFDSIRHRSSFLLSTILAIAVKYSYAPTRAESIVSGNRPPNDGVHHGIDTITEQTWMKIRALAMSCFFQALISKVHCLEDVQATLLLCAWGLQDRGASPDPWIMAGTAYRLARRLGIHLSATTLTSHPSRPTARNVSSLQTYLCLYAFDRLLTVGFGRPETEGFDVSTLDTGPFMSHVEANIAGQPSTLDMLITAESAACVVAYVELANIARDYSAFINHTLKTHPQACRSEMEKLSGMLDRFAGRWLRARSPLAAKLGPSSRLMKLLYSHIRLCLHSVPLKPAMHSGSQLFLQTTGLHDNSAFLQQCLKKAQDSATTIVQAFVDDAAENEDAILCYAYDYACMILVHSAATLLRLATTSIWGTPSGMSQFVEGADADPERVTAMRYCSMAITALVESDRSAIRFPCDMACNLSSIARESGMVISDWIGQGVLKALEERGYGEDTSNIPVPATIANPANDFSLFTDFDSFLYPDFFDNMAMFNTSM